MAHRSKGAHAPWLGGAAMAALAISVPAGAQVAPTTTPPAQEGAADQAPSATTATAQAEQPSATPARGGLDDVVVTARSRGERLLSVPVTVSAVGAAELTRAAANDLTTIGELTPSVIVGNYKVQGGGSIAIRGISSPATVAGFEQAVSVAVDGVQTSNGRIAQVGFFDVAQVEVLKGPQALFFGKNSPAGVISVTTAGPTDRLEVSGGASYEFVADEVIGDAAISGPVSDTLGFRVAVRYRDQQGWMYNDAQAIANPFYRPNQPAGAAQLPGAGDRRYGNRELLGRLTLDWRPTSNFSALFKLFGSRYRDDGPGLGTQNIGPCTGPLPRLYGVADPFGECRRDNHTSVGDLPAAKAQGFPDSDRTGRQFGNLDFVTSSLKLSLDSGPVTFTSLTGYNHATNRAQYGLDSTVYSQLWVGLELDRIRELTQEFRAITNLHGPLNFVGGLFFQRTRRYYVADFGLNDPAYFNPATGRFDAVDSITRQGGRTLSAFGQAIWAITPQWELAVGARYTNERKNDVQQTVYGAGPFDVVNFTYPGETRPGTLTDRFSVNNISPEATLTWRPDRDHTVYLAYKTGFKSGGYIASLPTRATQIADLDFGPERVKGFELGAKGLFLDGRVRVTAAAFGYDFTDLQVNAYDPVRVTFVVSNAGKVEQRGGEVELNWRLVDGVDIHGAVTYVHNRFRDYTGQCYGYAFPTGSTRATAVPPPRCSFANGTTLALQQVFDGRAPARSPDWSGNAGFVLSRPSGSLKLSLTGDTFFSGGYFASDTQAPTTYQDALFRFNASASVAAADDRWRVSLVGRNLSNEYYLLFGSDRTGGSSVPGAIGEQRGLVSRGREIVVQTAFRF